jgi:hypothetical protein
MAGLGAKNWSFEEEATSSDINGYLADQVVMRFPNAATRDAAFGGAGEPVLAEGMICTLDSTNEVQRYDGSSWVTVAPYTPPSSVIGVALSDETTAITTGNAKCTIRAPFAMTLTGVRANLNTASTSGTPTVDINVNGSSVLSTKLTIDVNELTSVTAATPPVISSASVADDDNITFDIDVAGTGAKGLKVWIYATRL